VATIVQFWAGAPIYRAAWAAARHGSTNMNTLIAVGTSVAYAYSAFVTLWPRLAVQWGCPQHLYFETAVIIIALILLGRWLEARAKKQTSAAIRALMGLQAKTARVIRSSVEQDIPIGPQSSRRRAKSWTLMAEMAASVASICSVSVMCCWTTSARSAGIYMTIHDDT
jgi:cation transport ATPase